MDRRRNRHKTKSQNQVIEEIFVQPKEEEKPRTSKIESRLDSSTVGVPLDYSFRKVFTLQELRNGTPREYRVGVPKKAQNGKYITSSMWANYNHISDLDEVNTIVKLSLFRPESIAWLDVSFNDIESISNQLLDLKSLKILYLHGNKLKFFIDVYKLKSLKNLRNLTLHGNPIEENAAYRSMVTKALPQLVNFDFSLVTKF